MQDKRVHEFIICDNLDLLLGFYELSYIVQAGNFVSMFVAL